MQLFTSGGVDKPVVSAGEDQKWNFDLPCALEDCLARRSPLAVEPARNLAVDERIGAVGLDHLRNPGQCFRIDLVVRSQGGQKHRCCLAEGQLPAGYGGLEPE